MMARRVWGEISAVYERRVVSGDTDIVSEDRSCDIYPHLGIAVRHFEDPSWTEDNLGVFFVYKMNRKYTNKTIYCKL